MAPRTTNSTIVAASISEAPSLPLPSPTVHHGQDPSSTAATNSDVAPPVTSPLENSISNLYGASSFMFDPSPTGVISSYPVADLPISRPFEHHSTAPFGYSSTLASTSIVSQIQTTMLPPFPSFTLASVQTVPSLASFFSGTTIAPTQPQPTPFFNDNNPFLGTSSHVAYTDITLAFFLIKAYLAPFTINLLKMTVITWELEINQISFPRSF
uniref:Uncharacterized protein n=1 Tax=Cannabis sativa TaxID=3483 RepID=A0A803Q1Z9_CANSA